MGAGRLDDARQLLRDEVLPALQRLGDQRAQAIAMGLLAEIQDRQGEPDLALGTLRRDVLPVLERQGDLRSSALANGKIARLLFRQGRFAEAARLRTQVQLPTLERLGDKPELVNAYVDIAVDLISARQLDAGRTYLIAAYQLAAALALPAGQAISDLYRQVFDADIDTDAQRAAPAPGVDTLNPDRT